MVACDIPGLALVDPVLVVRVAVRPVIPVTALPYPANERQVRD